MINITVEQQEINITALQPKPVEITVGSKPVNLTIADRDVTYGSGNLIEKQAAINLSGHKSVVLNDDGKLIYADNTTAEHANKILGISKNAAVSGGIVVVQTFAELQEPTWNWIPGKPIFLSTTGTLTQTVPASGFIIIIAFAVTSTKIFIDIKQPIIL